jgi:hypothetical protein
MQAVAKARPGNQEMLAAGVDRAHQKNIALILRATDVRRFQEVEREYKRAKALQPKARTPIGSPRGSVYANDVRQGLA